MCIASPKVGATSVPAPTQVSATGLQLGSAALINRSGGILGRLALTGGQRSARAQAGATAGTPEGGTTTNTLGGTAGLPSDFMGNAIFGGLKSLNP